MSSCERLILSLLILLSSVQPALAQAEEGSAVWVLTAGGEVDDESGYRADAGLAWMPSDATTFTLLGGHSNSSTDFEDFSSSTASLEFDHSFGLFGLSAGYRWWGDPDLVNSRMLSGSVYVGRDTWRVTANVERRESDFEPFAFDALIPVRTPQGPVLVPISGAADCNLDDNAYGISLRQGSEAWSFALGGTTYDYDNTACDVHDVVLPPQITGLPPISREIFRRIAARVLDAAGRLIGTQLTRENGFLDSTVNARLSYTRREWTWGLEYFHDREEFVGLQSDTLVGSLTLPAGERLDLELRAGATDADILGTVGFVGITLYAYLGNPR